MFTFWSATTQFSAHREINLNRITIVDIAVKKSAFSSRSLVLSHTREVDSLSRG